MTDEQLKELIRKNQDSLYAQCYRLGRKLANLELTKEIEELYRKESNEREDHGKGNYGRTLW
jgi:hypothetical protein